MNYPVQASIQLRAVLRALRQSRNLSQAEVGELLGVNQKRVARIENAPGVTAFDQIARMITVLGGRLVIETSDSEPQAPAATKRRLRKTPAADGNW
jgi:HTH-type transcriptional regulator/antitoxin HipB